MEINLLQNCTDQSLSDLINRYQFSFNSMIHLYETVPGLFIEIFLQNHLLLIYSPVSQNTVQKTLHLARMGKCSALCISIKKDNPLDLKRFSGSWFSETNWPSQFYRQLQGNNGRPSSSFCFTYSERIVQYCKLLQNTFFCTCNTFVM